MVHNLPEMAKEKEEEKDQEEELRTSTELTTQSCPFWIFFFFKNEKKMYFRMPRRLPSFQASQGRDGS